VREGPHLSWFPIVLLLPRFSAGPRGQPGRGTARCWVFVAAAARRRVRAASKAYPVFRMSSFSPSGSGSAGVAAGEPRASERGVIPGVALPDGCVPHRGPSQEPWPEVVLARMYRTAVGEVPAPPQDLTAPEVAQAWRLMHLDIGIAWDWEKERGALTKLDQEGISAADRGRPRGAMGSGRRDGLGVGQVSLFPGFGMGGATGLPAGGRYPGPGAGVQPVGLGSGHPHTAGG